MHYYFAPWRDLLQKGGNMRRRLVAVVAVLALAGAACGGSDDDGGTTPDAGSGGEGGGATTYTVKVDAKSDDYKIGTTAYFPNELKVAAGSTIDFESVFTGEPHTVTLGSLVDAGLKAAAADPDADEEPAELQKLPPLLPDGPGDANQMAANPCIVEKGDPPTDKACPEVSDPPAFDGTQSVYNSGFLPDGEHFELKLADDIKAGTYSFFCLLHRGAMTGEFTVVDADDADSADDVEAAGEKRLDDMIAKAKPAADAAVKGDFTPFAPAAAGQVVAGGASQDAPELLLTSFGPEEVSVKTGGTVTWVVVGPHTVSFNAPQDVASSALIKGGDGKFHANEKAFAPEGGPGQAPPDENAAPPDENAPPPAPKITDGGKFDGSGFRSSGIFLSFPPALEGYKLTFTKAGTYTYECLIHPEMEGTVKVG